MTDGYCQVRKFVGLAASLWRGSPSVLPPEACFVLSALSSKAALSKHPILVKLTVSMILYHSRSR